MDFYKKTSSACLIVYGNAFFPIEVHAVAVPLRDRQRAGSVQQGRTSQLSHFLNAVHPNADSTCTGLARLYAAPCGPLGDLSPGTPPPSERPAPLTLWRRCWRVAIRYAWGCCISVPARWARQACSIYALSIVVLAGAGRKSTRPIGCAWRVKPSPREHLSAQHFDGAGPVVCSLLPKRWRGIACLPVLWCLVCGYGGHEMALWRLWHPAYGVVYDEGEKMKHGTYSSTAQRAGP